MTVADDFSSGKLENLDAIASNINFLRGDLDYMDFAATATDGQEVAFHLAALHGGRANINTHPIEVPTSCCSTIAAASDAGVRKIVYASSACTYPTDLQADENSSTCLWSAMDGLRFRHD